MFIEQGMAFIFFRFLNGALIIALLAYLFNRYAMGALKEKMRQHKQQEKDRLAKRFALEQEQLLLAGQEQKQAAFVQRMENNINVWQAACRHHAQLRTQEKGLLRTRLERISLTQQQQLHADIVAGRLFSYACDQARKDLANSFSSEVRGKSFVQDIVTALKRRSV